MSDTDLRQSAPWPEALAQIIRQSRWTDEPAWSFRLSTMDRGQGSFGLTLVITVPTTNSYPPHQPTVVNHLFIVPAASYDYRSWRRWVLDRILDVQAHEACEFWEVDGEKPYAPSHGPGNDPYLIREVGTDEDRRTSFRGVLKPTDS